MIRKNEFITVKIEDMNNLGYGVGHLDGQAVFVRGGVVGERVSAKVIKATKTYLVALCGKIEENSPNRCESDCKSYPACGGCVYRHITYGHELDLKRSYVRNAFKKAGLAVEVEPVRHTGEVSGYRNKAQYPILRGKDGHLQIGFFAGSSHRLVPSIDCRLQPALFGHISQDVLRFLEKNHISAYDESTGKGLVRHLYLRYGESTGETLVCLVINGQKLPHEDEFADEITAEYPSVVGVLLNENTANTNVVLGDSYRLLRGRNYLTDTLCGLSFKISPESFYQVNRNACELLYRIAKEKANLTGGETVVDLYCGIGTIGLTFSDKAGEILGLEIVPEAVENAKENAKINHIANANFVCGDAGKPETLLNEAKKYLQKPLRSAILLLDPPRKGTTPELIKAVEENGISKIVYISCNPDTLARDCAIFAGHGYEIGTVTPVDLFPRTGHVENVVAITKNKGQF